VGGPEGCVFQVPSLFSSLLFPFFPPWGPGRRDEGKVELNGGARVYARKLAPPFPSFPLFPISIFNNNKLFVVEWREMKKTGTFILFPLPLLPSLDGKGHRGGEGCPSRRPGPWASPRSVSFFSLFPFPPFPPAVQSGSHTGGGRAGGPGKPGHLFPSLFSPFSPLSAGQG